MVSAARRQIIGGSGGGGAPINKSRRRRPQIVGGAARPAHGSSLRWPISLLGYTRTHIDRARLPEAEN